MGMNIQAINEMPRRRDSHRHVEAIRETTRAMYDTPSANATHQNACITLVHIVCLNDTTASHHPGCRSRRYALPHESGHDNAYRGAGQGDTVLYQIAMRTVRAREGGLQLVLYTVSAGH